MRVGVLKEIKAQEYRVGLTPAGARELTERGHQVFVEKACGSEIGLFDDMYLAAGATVIEDAQSVMAESELLIKVKEPQPQEYARLKPHHILFTFLHLAPDLAQCDGLIASGASCIAYETITGKNGGLPLLAPMSEVAGRLSIQAAARCLEKAIGGAGILLGGVPGVAPANVLVLGGGVVGLNAARMAAGLGARVTIVDKSLERLKTIDELYGPQITTLYSTTEAIESQLQLADAVIGAVLIPGASAPKLVSEAQLELMKPGSVLVDVAIDQGGCFATSKPTTHSDPTFTVKDVVHYCVANMPGAVAKTSTMALTNATLPYVLALADNGLSGLTSLPGFAAGLNVCAGNVTNAAVAQALNKPYVAADAFIK